MLVSGMKFSKVLELTLEDNSIPKGFILVGEQTASLSAAVARVSSYYTKRIKTQAENISNVFEPLVITVVALTVAIIVILLLYPIYDMLEML